MEFIAKNYFLIIIIAAFLLFALIGYMVDTEKKRKKGGKSNYIGYKHLKI